MIYPPFDLIVDRPGGSDFEAAIEQATLDELIDAIFVTATDNLWSIPEKLKKIAVLAKAAEAKRKELNKTLTRVMEDRNIALSAVRELAERIVDECEEVGADGSADIFR